MSGKLSRRKSSTAARDYISANPAVKIVLLGKKGVGKSAITVRLLTRRFIGEYDPDLETCSRYITKVNGEEVISQIKDTAQKIDEDGLRSHVQWADCIVLVYSIVDADSLREISRIKRIIDKKDEHSELKPIVIIGNKADLGNAMSATPTNGARYASDVGCPYHEISARESYVDVEKVFHNIIDMTIRCTIIKEQISKLCVPQTVPVQREPRERKSSFKSIVKNLTRQKTVKEEIVLIDERLAPSEQSDRRSDHNRTTYGKRERSSTCTF
eukprot:gene5143-5793_t